MVKKIIESDLREQAGSDSYNRFEYQVHWAVYYMIKQVQTNSDFYIFCEFHDDMAKMDLSDSPKCAEFFQVKTNGRYKEWKINHLTQTKKNKSEKGFKHSFLGFLFYNFLKFDEECTKCHFVSNIGFETKIRLWQSIIEDGKSLQEEESKLYEELKDLLKKEFETLEDNAFNQVYDRFVQNTFLYHGELPLSGYENVVSGSFFELIKDTDMFVSNSNRIFKDVIEKVRRKSKQKIQTPISYQSLKDKKGISSEVFSQIKDQINTNNNEQVYRKIEDSLNVHGKSTIKIKIILNALKRHHRKLLNFSDKLYIDSSDTVTEEIDKILEENYDKLEDFSFIEKVLLEEIIESNLKIIEKDIGFNKVLLEGILYERIFS